METTKKSFWSKPEGTTGTIFLGLLAAAGFYFWGKIVPFVLMVLTNTIYTVVAGLVLLALIYVILDPKFRTLVWYMYKVAMRSITSVFVQIDPIGIIKTYIEDLKNKRTDMNDQILKLKGEIGKLARSITENNLAIEDSMKRSLKAKEMNMINEATLLSREAGRLKGTNDTLIPLKDKMDKMYTFLNKMYESSGYLIRDMESEISAKEKEYAAIKASNNAMRGALSIINGDDNKKMMFDDAMEFLQDDMGKKVGEMERFMEMSTSFINGVDIQNGVYQDTALKMLDEYSEKDFTFLLDTPKSSPIKINPQPVAEPLLLQNKSKFDDLM